MASNRGARFIDRSFNAQQVKQEITNAVTVVRKSLDATRNPKHPEDVPHTYHDKFQIVELTSRAALSVQLNTLGLGFGLTPEKVKVLQDRRGNKTVGLRLDCSTTCKFIETRTREEESATRHEKQSVFGKTTYKSVTTITEHFWRYDVQWSVIAVIGTGDVTEQLASRSASHTLMTRAKDPVMPLPEKRAFDPIEVEITWLLDACKTGAVDFAISRKDPTTCHTPRRNPEVDGMLHNATQLMVWFSNVKRQVEQTYRDGYANLLPEGVESPNFSVIKDNVFAPITVMLALEETPSNSDASSGGGGAADGSPASTFSPADFDKIVSQQQNDMVNKFAQIAEVLPTDGIITSAEANMVVCAGYSTQVWRQYNHAVQAVEDMLMQQVVAAIGKRVTPADFAKYMAYHNRQLYRPEFAPRGFCYAVRRPDHYPEGTLSIEDQEDNQPIPTTALYREQGHHMRFALSAAVEVEFQGEHYVHSVVFHKFSNSAPPRLQLIARARQFSSFMLLAGSLASGEVFQPTHALIIQNKDELKIPLMLETIPAPQEFKDAIESLSPEQQAFCKAYRKMQLAGTLFAVAVVQIKPQLERLLNLPYDALTKEVKMCQDLMSLFIEYQIPSDLLAYAGPEVASSEAKVKAVKGYIANIHAMLDTAKKEELEEEERRYKKAHPIPVTDSDEECDMSFNGGGGMRMMMKNVSRGNKGGGGGGGGGLRKMKKKKAKGGASRKRDASASALAAKPKPAAPEAPKASKPTPEKPSSSVEEPQSPQTPLKDDAPRESGRDAGAFDYTLLPAKLDANFDRFDRFNALRATTISLGSSWTKSYQRGLLSKPESKSLFADEQRTERERAFDLLDALSKSGARPLVGCSLHVVVAATHCFDLDLMNTVVQDNVNPIDRVEASGLIMASTIHARPPQALVQGSQAPRIADAALSALTD